MTYNLSLSIKIVEYTFSMLPVLRELVSHPPHVSLGFRYGTLNKISLIMYDSFISLTVNWAI